MKKQINKDVFDFYEDQIKEALEEVGRRTERDIYIAKSTIASRQTMPKGDATRSNRGHLTGNVVQVFAGIEGAESGQQGNVFTLTFPECKILISFQKLPYQKAVGYVPRSLESDISQLSFEGWGVAHVSECDKLVCGYLPGSEMFVQEFHLQYVVDGELVDERVIVLKSDALSGDFDSLIDDSLDMPDEPAFRRRGSDDSREIGGENA